MSPISLTAALGIVTTGLAEPRQTVALLDRSFFSANAKSWLGFLVLVSLAVWSFTTAMVNPEQAFILYG
jgi:hypothetical protein